MSSSRPRMRIANFIPTLSGGGAERQLQYVSTELARRGHEVLVAFSHDGTSPWSADGVSLVHLHQRSSWDPRLFTGAAALMRDWAPDIVQSWGVQMDIILGTLQMISRRRWVLREPTSGVFYERGVKAKARCALGRAGASLVVANSRGGLAYWSRCAPRVKSVLIANALDVEAIDHVQPRAFPVRPAILFVGRLEQSKNVDVLLEAVALLFRDHPGQLVICGEGADRPRLEALAQARGLTGRVVFTGYTESPWSYMTGADLFVSLSRFEGSPNAVLEAFAAGVPVLLSDIEAHREIADDRSAWFTPIDAVASAAAMQDILFQSGERRERVEEARRRACGRSIAATADDFERVYADAIAGAT
jgi:glycosyltransferase involved in cell wall biosynthesis